MNRIRTLFVAVGCAAAISLVGCEQKPASQAPPAPSASAKPALSADLFVTEAPAGARGVKELKADSAATGEVVMTGRIGGRVEPFVDGAAVFLLVDRALPTCDENPGDKCPTPWDYCCEPREDLVANTATVQIVDDAGKPLAIDVEGQHGLAPKADVTVVGKVVERGDGVLVVQARKLYVKPAAG